MTNYEYLLKNKEELVKKILICYIAKVNEKIVLCRNTHCDECAFASDKRDGNPCSKTVKEWLDEEHIEKLLSCPHCGKSNIVLDEDENTNMKSFVCDFNNGGCGASGGYRETKEEAIEAWNRRA